VSAGNRPLCVHVLPETGDAGAENQALYLLRALVERGDLELELVCFARGRRHADFEALGIPVREVPRGRRLVLDFLPRVRRLRRLYRDRPPELVHSWLFEGNTIALAATRRWPGTRVILAQRSGTMERAMPGHLRAIRLLYPRADHALSNSREGAELLVDAGLAPEAVTVVPQGVPPERVALGRGADEVREAIGIPADAPLVATVGRADETKDLPGLLIAMEFVRRSRPDAHLVLVGPDTDDLAALELELPERAMAVGWQAAPADFMAAADVVAIPSWTEGSSNVAAEALTLGRPVATTDTGDHPTAVAAAGGRVVPIRDPARLGAAVAELLDDPPDPGAVRAAAERELSLARGVDATVAVYERLLAGIGR
jgi:glycosyltransferase involved in cell wall biosynthesis